MKIMVCLVFTMIVLVVGCLGLESIYPLKVTRDVLTNGERTLVVEGMAHIGTPRFYADIRSSISKEKAAGAVYLYEGVRDEPAARLSEPATINHKTTSAEITDILVGENMQDGVDIMRLYSVLAKSAGLEVQPQESFMDIAGGPDVNADMSAQELLTRLRTSRDLKTAHDTQIGASHPPVPTDPKSEKAHDSLDVDQLEVALDKMSGSERTVVGFLVRGVMSFVVRVSDNMDVVPYSEDIDKARTLRLAEFVQLRTEKRMVSTYGSRHVDGLLDELRHLDSRWERTERTWREPFVR